MKRKDQMLIIIELLNDVDYANTVEDRYSIEYYEVVLKRCNVLIDQYPKNDPFNQILSHIFGDIHFKIEEVIAKLSEVSK